MKKIALALAISSALTSHFALAVPGDGEAPLDLKRVGVQTDSETTRMLNNVRGNAGINLNVSTDAKLGAVKTTDVGVMEAVKKSTELQARTNEVLARLLAQEVVVKLDKPKLEEAEREAITKCNNITADTINNGVVREIFKGTPVSQVKVNTETKEQPGNGILKWFEQAYKDYENIASEYTKITNTVNEVKGVVNQGLERVKNLAKLPKIDIKNPSSLIEGYNKVVNIGQKYEGAKRSFEVAIEKSKNIQYSIYQNLDKAFKRETKQDQLVYEAAIKNIELRCGKAFEVLENGGKATEQLNKEYQDAKDHYLSKAIEACYAGSSATMTSECRILINQNQ